METVLAVVIILLVLLSVRSHYSSQKRQREFSKSLPILESLVVDGKHIEALEMLRNVSALRWRYKLEPEQREKITEIEIECLEKLNRTPEAVVSLAEHLATAYEIGAWPEDLLSKWICLYKSCEPIDVEKFYFCETCGLHPETEALLRYAIKNENCRLPRDFPGKGGSKILVQSRPKKFKKLRNFV